MYNCGLVFHWQAGQRKNFALLHSLAIDTPRGRHEKIVSSNRRIQISDQCFEVQPVKVGRVDARDRVTEGTSFVDECRRQTPSGRPFFNQNVRPKIDPEIARSLESICQPRAATVLDWDSKGTNLSRINEGFI